MSRRSEKRVFMRFRRRLADFVTVAINSGERVGAANGCRCPAGCHPRASARKPAPFVFARLFRIPDDAAVAFAWAFDGTPCEEWLLFPQYADLGRLYRNRFR